MMQTAEVERQFHRRRSFLAEPLVIFHVLSRVLVLVCVGLSLFLIWNIFIVKPALKTNLVPGGERKIAEEDILLPVTEFSSYAEILKKRDVFLPPKSTEDTIAKEVVPPAAVAPDPATTLSANYRIVGIVMDKKPQAIIEDVKNGTTLFLSQGDALGDGRIVQIGLGRVLVLLGDRKIELSP